MTPSPQPEKRLSFIAQLEKCKEAKDIVEVLTESREITGTVHTVGDDYIGVVSSVERVLQSTAVGQDGKKEAQEYTLVTELEVFLKLEDIRAVSKVLKSVPK